jgi:hypothetical protein
LSVTYATVEIAHRPPFGAGMPSAFSASAIAFSVVFRF